MYSDKWITVVFFLGLFFVCTQAIAQVSDDSGPNQNPRLHFPHPISVVGPENVSSPDRSVSEAETGRREMENLNVQKGMLSVTKEMSETNQRAANYAWWSTVVAAVGVVLSFAAFVGLLYTLKLTRASNRAALDANKAALEGLELARSIGQAQLSPHLQLTAFSFGLSQHGYIVLAASCKATGQTPAEEVELVVHLSILVGMEVEEHWINFSLSDVLFNEEVSRPPIGFSNNKLDLKKMEKGRGIGFVSASIMVFARDTFGDEVTAWYRADLHQSLRGNTPMKIVRMDPISRKHSKHRDHLSYHRTDRFNPLDRKVVVAPESSR